MAWIKSIGTVGFQIELRNIPEESAGLRVAPTSPRVTPAPGKKWPVRIKWVALHTRGFWHSIGVWDAGNTSRRVGSILVSGNILVSGKGCPITIKKVGNKKFKVTVWFILRGVVVFGCIIASTTCRLWWSHAKQEVFKSQQEFHLKRRLTR